jgi:osmoprotectant transport system ATP-binding protein
VADARATGQDWVLVVEDGRRPVGWARVAGLPADGTLSDAELDPLGHTFGIDGDSARAVLDAAILSPTGLAVGIDGDGGVVGVAGQQDLVTALAAAGTGTGAGADAGGDTR